MTKKELVDQIAEKRGMSAQEVLSVVEDLMKLVKRNVAADEEDSVDLGGRRVIKKKKKKKKGVTQTDPRVSYTGEAQGRDK